jgi:undecaprenyl-diphosphatase
MGSRLATAFAHFDQAELRFCRYLNRPSGRSLPRAFFHAVSRLGDGFAWYALIVAQLFLPGGPAAAMHLAATGGAGVLAYRFIKTHTVRERPFITHPAIDCAAAPLDRYSFPSGHTLHAVAFAWQAVAAFPETAFVLVPLALAIAVSRVVLGLHYPTDVLVGAVLGCASGIAGAALA